MNWRRDLRSWTKASKRSKAFTGNLRILRTRRKMTYRRNQTKGHRGENQAKEKINWRRGKESRVLKDQSRWRKMKTTKRKGDSRWRKMKAITEIGWNWELTWWSCW